QLTRDPKRVITRLEVGQNRWGLGLLLLTAGRPSEAEAEFRRELDILQDRSDAEPKDHLILIDLSSTHNNLGDAIRAQGRIEESRASYERSVAIRERLVKENPDESQYRGRLGFSLRRRGLARGQLGDLAGAGDDARQAFSLFESV